MKNNVRIYTHTPNWRLAVGGVVVLTLVVAFAPHVDRFFTRFGLEFFGANFRRVFVNYHDMRVYYRLGVWARSALLPYRDYVAEYPPLSMLIFAAPHAVLRLFRITPSFASYRIVYAIMSGFVLFFTIFFISMVRGQLQRNGFFAQHTHTAPIRNQRIRQNIPLFFLFCIASIYFTYNRFDIFPSLFLFASIYCFMTRRVVYAFVLCACSFSLKWYAAVAIPIYTAYLWQQQDWSSWIKGCLMSAATIIIIHLPVFLYGGIEGVLVPYLVHVDRSGNYESVFSLVRVVFPVGDGNILRRVFLAFQLLFPFSAFFVRRLSLHSVAYGVVTAIAVFIFFAAFQSPQWILWLSPFLLACAINTRDLFRLFFLEGITYYYFPVLFGFFYTFSISLSVLTFALIPQFIAMGAVIVYGARNTLRMRAAK